MPPPCHHAGMCGRYTLKSSAVELQREFNLETTPVLEARYNIAPTQAAPVILDKAPRELTLARWGLLPFWAKDAKEAHKMINARSETLTQKKAFAEALEHRRCLVPCDGFFEWKKDPTRRTPFYIASSAGHPLAMAGLYSTWRSPDGVDVLTYTIVTTRANEEVRGVHDRMPAFLDGDERARWLSGPTKDTEALLQLLHPWRGKLALTEVSPHVNSVAADDPECIEPAKAVQLSLL